MKHELLKDFDSPFVYGEVLYKESYLLRICFIFSTHKKYIPK